MFWLWSDTSLGPYLVVSTECICMLGTSVSLEPVFIRVYSWCHADMFLESALVYSR